MKAHGVAHGGEPHDFVEQDNETDWDFIWRLAERIGFEFVVDDASAHFRRPTGDGAVELEWPTTLHSFRPRVTAVQQVGEVTILAHDPKTKEVIEASVTSPDPSAGSELLLRLRDRTDRCSGM